MKFSPLTLAELRIKEAELRRMSARQAALVVTGATQPARLAASKRRDQYTSWANEWSELISLVERTNEE